MPHLVQTGESQSVTLPEVEVIFIGRNIAVTSVSIKHIHEVNVVVFFKQVYNYINFPIS